MAGRNRIVARMEASGAVTVIRLASSTKLVQVAEALLAGGLDCIELTMTIPGALKAMEKVAQEFGDRVLLGAGTVLDAKTVDAAILAGARFVVGPALRLSVIEVCHRHSVVAVPGTFSPTEIATAWEAGANLVKVFPARVGGPRYIKDILGPLPQVKLMPTGGVTLENAAAFIRAGAVAVGVGSALVDAAAVQDGRLQVITDRAASLLSVIREAREQQRLHLDRERIEP